MVREVFNVLKTGNFYFPYLHKKDKFKVIDTLELDLKIGKMDFDYYLKHISKFRTVYFSFFADPIWDAVHKFIKGKKEYKNCYLVPIKIDTFGKVVTASVDVLKKV